MSKIVSQAQRTLCVQKAQMHCAMMQNPETLRVKCYAQNAETCSNIGVILKMQKFCNMVIIHRTQENET